MPRSPNTLEFRKDLVSIVVVSWNSADCIVECARSIAAQSYENVEFILVDNGSHDRSVELVRSVLEPDILILNRRNEGYCRANNRGISAARGEFVWLLNPDAYPLVDAARILVAGARSLPEDVGVFSPKLLKPGRNPDGSRVIDSTGISPNLWRLAPKDRGEWEEDRGQYDDKTDIFGVTGAAAFFRRSSLEVVRWRDEYFDEDFFAYYEDVDLAWRMNNRGVKARFVPEAVVFHGRKSADAKNPRRWMLKNKYLMLMKNTGVRDAVWILPLLVPAEAAKQFLSITLGKSHHGSLALSLRYFAGALSRRVRRGDRP
ncbi:MAG: glycosyltransferase family 2 protein [Planctomycetota bacterium]|jgi:GT2 family glycosyltransferase